MKVPTGYFVECELMGCDNNETFFPGEEEKMTHRGWSFLYPDEPKSEIEIAPYIFSLKTILKKVNEKNPIVIILSQLTEEENLSLIDTVPQKINVILGNCSRDYPNGWYRIYKNTILAKAGVGGKTVGKVKMVFDKDWNRSDCSVDFISVGDNLRENPQIIHLLNQWRVE